ncbi:MAG: MarC family protein [bacterium]
MRRAKGARDEYGPDGTRLRRLLRHRQSVTAAVLLAVLALTSGMLLISNRMQRLLGDTGTNVLSRVLGLVLAALSVQIILDGIRGSFGLR